MCQKCNKVTSSMRIDPNAKNNVNFQLYANDKYAETLAHQLVKITNFQKSVSSNLVNELKKKLVKYQTAYSELNKAHTISKSEADALRSENAVWQKENKKLTDENRMLRQSVLKLTNDVTVLKNKLIDERHSAGPSSRNRPAVPSSHRHENYGQLTTGPQSANSLIPDRMSVALLDSNPKPTPPTYIAVPSFPKKRTDGQMNVTPLTVSRLKMGGMSNDTFGPGSKTFHFDHM